MSPPKSLTFRSLCQIVRIHRTTKEEALAFVEKFLSLPDVQRYYFGKAEINWDDYGTKCWQDKGGGILYNEEIMLGEEISLQKAACKHRLENILILYRSIYREDLECFHRLLIETHKLEKKDDRCTNKHLNDGVHKIKDFHHGYVFIAYRYTLDSQTLENMMASCSTESEFGSDQISETSTLRKRILDLESRIQAMQEEKKTRKRAKKLLADLACCVQ